MWRVALLVVCACNQTFGLRDTVLQDATRPDRPSIDAAPSCPPLGTVPHFSGVLHQAVVQNCSNYTMSWSARSALATCFGASGGIFEGRIDDAMHVAIGFDPPSGESFDMPRLSPEGGEAFVRVYLSAASSFHYESFTRAADGTWIRGYKLPIMIGSYDISSTVTRGPRRRMLVFDPYNGGPIREYNSDGMQGWTQVGMHTIDEISVVRVNNPMMTEDGLRLVFYGQLTPGAPFEVLYTDRPSVDVWFGPARSIDGQPIYDGQLTPDCERLYFSALSSIFYAERAR